MGSHPKPKRLAQEEMNAMEKLQTFDIFPLFIYLLSLSQAGLSTKDCSYFKRLIYFAKNIR